MAAMGGLGPAGPQGQGPVTIDNASTVGDMRPPRKNHYSLDELGPTDFEFRGVTYRRNDLHFENKRGMQIEYSMWDVVGNWNSTTEPPSPLVTQDVAKPCIIYLHGKTPETKVEYETQRICFHRTKHLDSSTLHPK